MSDLARLKKLKVLLLVFCFISYPPPMIYEPTQ
jgi:hypothetical protein